LYVPKINIFKITYIIVNDKNNVLKSGLEYLLYVSPKPNILQTSVLPFQLIAGVIDPKEGLAIIPKNEAIIAPNKYTIPLIFPLKKLSNTRYELISNGEIIVPNGIKYLMLRPIYNIII